MVVFGIGINIAEIICIWAFNKQSSEKIEIDNFITSLKNESEYLTTTKDSLKEFYNR